MATFVRSRIAWQRQLLILFALTVFFVALVLPFCMAVLLVSGGPIPPLGLSRRAAAGAFAAPLGGNLDHKCTAASALQ